MEMHIIHCRQYWTSFEREFYKGICKGNLTQGYAHNCHRQYYTNSKADFIIDFIEENIINENAPNKSSQY